MIDKPTSETDYVWTERFAWNTSMSQSLSVWGDTSISRLDDPIKPITVDSQVGLQSGGDDTEEIELARVATDWPRPL